MTGGGPTSPGDAWLEEGRRASAAVDPVGSAVVVGRDAEAAAWVALGIARTQATYRRVAVADLVGESPPLQDLVDPDADPHGISDSFLYGVSLNKIAHQADQSGNLFVLPSGSEAVATKDVFRSDRWRRLAGGFREVGALLLLVAQADTPGLDALAASVDGVVIVGDIPPGTLGEAAPLAVVAPTRRRPARATPNASSRTPNGMPDVPPPASRETPRTVPLTPAADAGAAASRPWLRWATLAAFALLAVSALGFYLLPKGTAVHGDVPPHPDSTRRAAATNKPPNAPPGRTPDSVARPVAPRALTALTVANPADSGSALLYSVYMTSANTPDGASRALDSDVASAIPVIAPTAVLEDGAPAYRMLVGAYPTRDGAASLLATLRARGVLGAGTGMITRTPYALRVADSVPIADVRTRMQALAQKNVPVYALSRGNGTVALYAGAFETPEQAAWLSRALQNAGVASTLVYRTGRSL